MEGGFIDRRREGMLQEGNVESQSGRPAALERDWREWARSVGGGTNCPRILITRG